MSFIAKFFLEQNLIVCAPIISSSIMLYSVPLDVEIPQISFVLHNLGIFEDYKQFYFVEIAFICGLADVSL